MIIICPETPPEAMLSPASFQRCDGNRTPLPPHSHEIMASVCLDMQLPSGSGVHLFG